MLVMDMENVPLMICVYAIAIGRPGTVLNVSTQSHIMCVCMNEYLRNPPTRLLISSFDNYMDPWPLKMYGYACIHVQGRAPSE